MIDCNINTSKKLLTRREFLVGSGAVLTVAALAACSNKITSTSGTSSSSTPKYGGTLKLIDPSAPSVSIGYPPELLTSGANTTTAAFLEGLLRQKADGTIIPWLAESYKVADDLKSVTFKLRKGVKFHDGSDFTTEIAKWNIDNIIAAKVEPLWTSVDMIDDDTIRINFSAWRNTLFGGLVDNCIMISKTAFDKNGLDWVRKNPVGTGPFKFVSFQPDVSCKGVRNPDYWQEGKPYLEGVEILYIVDGTTRKAAMQTGEADMVSLNADKLAADLRDAGLTVDMVLTQTAVLIPDSINPDSPWSKQKVREAAEYAINREAMAKALSYGFWSATYQIPAPGLPAYNPNFTLARKYDPGKAKQLLAEAGYPDGFKTTLVGGFHYNKDVGVAIQGYLAEAGIIVNIESPEMPKFAADYMWGSWKNAVLLTLTAGQPNYNYSLNFFFGPGRELFKSWERPPEYLKALDASINTPAPDASLMRAATDILTEQAALIPTYVDGPGYAYQPYVKDTHVKEAGSPIWLPEQIWLDK